MTSPRSKHLLICAWAIIILVLLVDQAVKIWIKTHFALYEDHQVTPWFHILFVQNRGMAFGLDFLNKYILTFLRIGLFIFLAVYLRRVVRVPRVPAGYVVSISLVAAGAIGNIIDCIFYGEIFNDPLPPAVASFVPWGDGYGTLFQGRVVDMLYFPLLSWTWPQWMPVIGGNQFTFFDPVFNIADAAISTGMIAIVLFYFKYMERTLSHEKDSADTGNN